MSIVGLLDSWVCRYSRQKVIAALGKVTSEQNLLLLGSYSGSGMKQTKSLDAWGVCNTHRHQPLGHKSWRD